MQQVHDFIKSKKPKGFTGYHFAVMLCLMHSGQSIELSHTTIGERTGMSRYTVRNVLTDLRAWKWISLSSGKRQYNTNLIEVQWGNLPQPLPPVQLVISQHAVTLAEGFKNIWVARCSKYKNKRGWTCTRPLRKDWKRRWEPVFQKLLNEGYEYNEMAITLNEYRSTNKDPRLLKAGPQSRELFPDKEAK